MALFARHDQEGPGIVDDDVTKGLFITYLTTYFRKIGPLTLTNLAFFLTHIPAMIVAYIFVIFFLPRFHPALSPDGFIKVARDLGLASVEADLTLADAAMQLYFLLVFVLVMFLVGSLAIVVGPVVTGFANVYRYYARELPCFLWSDALRSLKSNWKQATAATLISLAASFFILNTSALYLAMPDFKYSGQLSIVFLVLFLFFLCMQIFIYPMIATIELPLKKIYRNALFLFIGRLPYVLGIMLVNLVFLLVIPALLLLTFTYIAYAIVIIYYLFFVFSYVQYLNSFFSWYLFEKYIVKPVPSDDDTQTHKVDKNEDENQS